MTGHAVTLAFVCLLFLSDILTNANATVMQFSLMLLFLPSHAQKLENAFKTQTIGLVTREQFVEKVRHP